MNKILYSFLLVGLIFTTNSIMAQKVITTIQGEKISTNSTQGDHSEKIATTSFVNTAIGSVMTQSLSGNTATLTAPQALNSVINVTGTLTANGTLLLPTSAVRTWIINNQTTGNFSLTVKYTTGTGVTVNQGKATTIYGDGTQVNYANVDADSKVADVINDNITTIAPSQNAVYDALLLKAPIASPSFTGTPTAPTVTPSGDSSTKLATTEFVQNAITSISASSHVPVSIGTANGLSISGQQLSLGTASGSNTGALSSTDWTTFNSKEPSLALGTATQYYRGDKTWQTLTTDVVTEGTNKYFTDARSRAAISLTTTGASGSATYNNSTGVLNIPTYTLSGLGGQAALSGTGFVKASGSTISYDNTTYAPLASPTFTGTPSLPTGTTGVTQTAGDNSTKLATTAFVTSAITTAVPNASETVIGKVQLATAAETTAGSIDYKAVHPAGLKVELDKKEPKIIAGTTSQYYKGDKTWATLDKAAVGLGNVDNTTDINKPVSTATQTALNLKANLASPTFTGTVVLPNTTSIGSVDNTELSYLDGVTSNIQTQLNSKTGTVTSVSALTIGTSGTTPTSTVATASTTPVITLNIPMASATGVTAGLLSKSDYDSFNTKQTALNGTGLVKATGTSITYDNTAYAPLASPILTGTPTAPTAAAGDNSQQLATTAFVKSAITTGSHQAVTLGTANGLSLSTQQLSLQLASTTTTGALSMVDYNSFNNKQDYIAAGVATQYYRGDKTWQTLNTTNVTEGTNLYFTPLRAITTLVNSTGVSGGTYSASPGTVNASDNIVGAIQKLDGNIAASWKKSGNGGTTPGTDFIGTTDAKDLVFKTNNTERMRIAATGDVTFTENVTIAKDLTSRNSFTTSDIRLKKNIKNLKDALATVNALRPVSYEKKNTIADTKYTVKENGFIAQEVKKVLPELVAEMNDTDKTLTVNYTAIIPLLTKAIQEQQEQINAQKKLITEQQAQIDQILKKLNSK